MSDFISKPDFDDAFERALNIKEPKLETNNGDGKLKFRKKPVEIDAEQYIKYGKLVKGMCNSQSCYVGGNTEPHVHTIHDNQIVLLEVGDWIIPEPDGVHFYPCKPDIFDMTYDKVD